MPPDSFTSALGQLDPASRALLDLSLRRGMRTEEIAELLGAEPWNVALSRDEALREVAAAVGMTRDEQLDEVRARLAELPAAEWLGNGHAAASQGAVAADGDGPEADVEPGEADAAVEPVDAGAGEAEAATEPSDAEAATEPSDPEAAAESSDAEAAAEAEAATEAGETAHAAERTEVAPEAEETAHAAERTEAAPEVAPPEGAAASESAQAPTAAAATNGSAASPTPIERLIAEKRAEAAAKPKTGTPPVREERQRSRLPILLGLLAVAIVVAVVLLVSGGSSDDDQTASQPPSSPPPKEPQKQQPAEPQQKPQPATAPFQPVAGNSVQGSASITGRRLKLGISGLPDPGGDSYTVWLYDSIIDARPIARAHSGSFKVTAKLPADWKRYRFIDVSRERADGNVSHSGRSVARAPISKLRP